MKKGNEKYVKFMLEYIKNNDTYSSKRLSFEYLKKHPDHTPDIRTKLNRIFGSYISLATKEECTDILYKPSKHYTYMSATKMMRFLKKLLNGEKCDMCELISKNAIKTGRNIIWRKFDELEKLEVHNGFAKMYFLGSSTNDDGYEQFKKLWVEATNE